MRLAVPGRHMALNALGAVVDFELGAFRSAVSGAVNITKRAP